LAAVWADIGPLRASIYTRNQDVVPVEHLLAIADNMGPASNRQVFSFVVDPPQVKEVQPPPPVEAAINAEGIQEVDLIVTPRRLLAAALLRKAGRAGAALLPPVGRGGLRQ